ncbi:hypothetical protein IMZ11_04955 [Microtetraspora sp. AC03309]|uniref:hypothetical protein n=1 Tax=Microtetraspora sp. AC03309 TaxID=2779376 RepID=UPI001E52350D|nr:hypothetical protein [Microtetraspora sp. AC03309]MCC5574988.1 hypothetical protein [Microtetraspora sp. AC03309]
MARRIHVRTAPLSIGTAVVTAVGLAAAVPASAARTSVFPAFVKPVRPAVLKPTVVLVRGGWADSSGWVGVIT